jgi:curved DNA-binding protein CbpA
MDQPNERAMNYFSACLRILELEEEVALSDEALKAAYKKAVVRAHPDKGGSEKEFEAVTRAYAYLGEILRRIRGGRKKEGKVEAPAALTNNRSQEAEAWKQVEPVHLNPKKLDMNAFNQMFEKTRIPDPEEAGYGDWLKGQEEAAAGAASKLFSGKFNRDVFNKTFQEQHSAKPVQQGGAMVVQEQVLSNRMGFATELGRGARDDYTAANEAKLGYTDLKKAYTEYNTFSHNTANVTVEARNLEQYSRERDKAPAPLADHEMMALQQAEQATQRAEEQRRLRHSQQQEAEDAFFKRMQRLVLRNE